MSPEFEALWRAEMREHGIPEDKITELWEAGRKVGREAAEAARSADSQPARDERRRRWRVRAARERWAERLARGIAFRLPKRIVRWAYIRVGAHATTGAHENTVVPDLSMMDALQRWEDA
jgi:hypothetical protein